MNLPPIFWKEFNEHFFDALITILNIFLLLSTIIWQTRNRRYQVTNELLTDLKEQNEAKDEVIKDIKRSKDQYKVQYQNIFTQYKLLQGEINTYKKFHQHEPLVKNP